MDRGKGTEHYLSHHKRRINRNNRKAANQIWGGKKPGLHELVGDTISLWLLNRHGCLLEGSWRFRVQDGGSEAAGQLLGNSHDATQNALLPWMHTQVKT